MTLSSTTHHADCELKVLETFFSKSGVLWLNDQKSVFPVDKGAKSYPVSQYPEVLVAKARSRKVPIDNAANLSRWCSV